MSIRIIQRTYGGPEVLEVEHVDSPDAAALAPGEVLVSVAAAGVNPIDIMTRGGGGMAAAGVISTPFTPGWDIAGTVAAIGPAVTELTVGQRVMGLVRFPHEGAAYAEYAVVPAENLVQAPKSLSDEEAGAMPMAAMTAWQALAETTTVSPGQRVLISGAGGGVGHVAVQIAHHLGAHVVALASTSKHSWLQDLGADEVIDYRDIDAVSSLSATVDVAFSLAAGSHQAALHSVKPNGLLIALGAGAGDLEDQAQQFGIRFAATHVRPERSWLLSVAELAAKGALKVTISEKFQLEDAARAHEELENGHSKGKIVLQVKR